MGSDVAHSLEDSVVEEVSVVGSSAELVNDSVVRLMGVVESGLSVGYSVVEGVVVSVTCEELELSVAGETDGSTVMGAAVMGASVMGATVMGATVMGAMVMGSGTGTGAAVDVLTGSRPRPTLMALSKGHLWAFG